MSKIKAYFQTFNTAGEYTGDWVDVTEDCDLKIGKVTQKLDASEFDVGIFSYGSFSLKLNNINGNYSDVDNINSMFVGKRSGTKVKLTFQIEHHEQYCGIAICGNSYLSEEVDVLFGLLNDESFAQDLRDSSVQFQVLAEESILDKVEINYSAISNGMTVSAILTAILNDLEILKVLSIGTISPKYNAVIDDVSDFENETVKSVIDDLLVISASVLYVNESELKVSERVETSTNQQTFYGQASTEGIENIQKLGKIKSGLSRTFNVWNWSETSLTSKDTNSQSKYGTREKEIGFDSVTNSTTKQAILDSYKTEFGNPLRELELTVILDGYNIRKLLDKINIDYPTPYSVKEGNVFPVYGTSKYSEVVYPDAEFGLELLTSEYWKIIGIKIDFNKMLIAYNVREV